MPAVSKVQARLMGADLARARAGKKTRTGMPIESLKHFASTARKALPYRSSSKQKRRRQIAAMRRGGG